MAKKKNRPVDTIQFIVQLVFLALFTGLMLAGRIQLWMVVFLGGVLLSLVFSRLYCGWACPINTTMRLSNWLKKTFKIRHLAIPGWLKHPVVRIILLAVFVALALMGKRLGVELPVLPAVVLLGFLLTLIFPDTLWHRYLCPYGTLLSVTARAPWKKMKIDSTACIECGACARVCPTQTIAQNEGHHQITANECLVCLNCQKVCAKSAIHYQ